MNPDTLRRETARALYLELAAHGIGLRVCGCGTKLGYVTDESSAPIEPELLCRMKSRKEELKRLVGELGQGDPSLTAIFEEAGVRP